MGTLFDALGPRFRGGERGKERGINPLKQPENPRDGPKLKVNVIWSRFSVTKSLIRSIGTRKITFCPHFTRFSDGFERYLQAPSDLESVGD
jgi:hypothetical protein